LRRVADAVGRELVDESSLREELLAAEMRLELGEIDEQEFRRIEEEILERMRAARGQREAPAVPRSGMRYAVDAIEADTGGEPATSATSPQGKERTGRARASGPPRPPADRGRSARTVRVSR
jgi:hypothetical protein